MKRSKCKDRKSAKMFADAWVQNDDKTVQDHIEDKKLEWKWLKFSENADLALWQWTN